MRWVSGGRCFGGDEMEFKGSSEERWCRRGREGERRKRLK